jgi:hypothetical protein
MTELATLKSGASVLMASAFDERFPPEAILAR